MPIYAIKNMSAPSLARALRTLLGMDPSAAGGDGGKQGGLSAAGRMGIAVEG